MAVLVPLITAVVPYTEITRPNFKIDLWLGIALEKSIQVVIVCDFESDIQPPEILKLKESFNINSLICIFGNFGSVGTARNAGMTRSEGKWLFFWDADDIPDIESTIEMVIEAENEAAEIAIGSFEVISLNSGKMELRTFKHLKRNPNVVGFSRRPGLWRFGFRESVYKNLFFQDLNMAEDQIFVYDALRLTKRISFSKKIVYRYFFGAPGSLTSDKDRVREITKSIDFLIIKLRSSKSNTEEYLRMMIAAQLITLIRHSNRRQLFATFGIIIRILFKNPILIPSIIKQSVSIVMDYVKNV